MTYSVYLLGCGIQDLGFVGRFGRGDRISSRLQNTQNFLGPAESPLMWMKK